MGEQFFYHSSTTKYAINSELSSTDCTDATNFFVKSLGAYGRCVLDSIELELGGNMRWRTISKVTELVFEWVRQKEFEEYPSRLSCIFAHPSLDNIKLWHQFQEQNEEYYTYKIASQSKERIANITVEAGWLVSYYNPVHHWSEMIDYARNYWSNTPHTNPLPEVLLALPAKIIGEIVDFQQMV